MDIPQTTPDQSSFFQRNKYLIKGFMISFLILALLIPTFFISQLIRERQERNEEVKREIASQWSSAQTITGPVLVIPYLQSEKDADNKLITSKRYAYFLPDDLKAIAVTRDTGMIHKARSNLMVVARWSACCPNC